MRLLVLPILALTAVAAPALAGTESGDAANPFTAPSTGQTTTSGLASATDASQQATVPGEQGIGDPQVPQAGDSKQSDGFYQQPKKDADGH